MKKVLVAGSLNIDLVLSVPRFPLPGETLLGESYTEYMGGKGANQASAAVLQGAPTTILGMIGKDAHGNMAKTKLRELGISANLTEMPVHTGLAFIEVDISGQNRIVVIPGANGVFSPKEALQAESLIASHDIIVLQHEIPLDTNFALASLAKKYHKTVLLNPAPAEKISPAMTALVDFLLPNEHELALLSGKPAETTRQIQEAMQALTAQGCACVVTTAGAQGVFCLKEAHFIHIPAPRVEAVDTTGAGDSFCGAFAAYLAHGMPLEESLKRAVCAASLSVTRKGAFGSSGTFSEIEELLL